MNKPAIIKVKKCRSCGDDFFPARPLQNVCCPRCAHELAKSKREKDERAAAHKALREGREALMTLADHAKITERHFNAYIKLRDRDRPCISCGRHHKGANHAGHYLSVGAHPELRFVEDNVNKQCQPCNTRKGGNVIEYRKGLITKIGTARVEWLEGPHTPTRYRVADLKEIAAKYRKMTKEIKT